MTAETETKRTGLAQARLARAFTPEIEEEYAAARLRFELGETVRERRTDLGLSQSELGRRAGMTQSAVARFEGGGTVPTIPVLDRLARALDLDLRVELTPHADSA
ncbi:helix-turn-helix domain-containing protein [Streptomyces sparsogenes]|uniref:Helix-turn-helix domain-containing protein n=2 Tax=Streptomyces TaxID=1883 RepID=A0A1R1SJ41_9ACTN|nr:helix-turn-helix domain-containing protein [Streptomyces sparsogenes DSM 40356]